MIYSPDPKMFLSRGKSLKDFHYLLFANVGCRTTTLLPNDLVVWILFWTYGGFRVRGMLNTSILVVLLLMLLTTQFGDVWLQVVGYQWEMMLDEPILDEVLVHEILNIHLQASDSFHNDNQV